MAHFAQIENNIVTQVIVIDNNDILDEQGNESEDIGVQFCINLLGGAWKQTSYNTNSGEHPQGSPLRKNYAGIGMTYDSTRDAFIPPQPFSSWVLDEDTCQWESPIPYPTDLVEGEVFEWDETSTQWILIEQEN